MKSLKNGLLKERKQIFKKQITFFKKNK